MRIATVDIGNTAIKLSFHGEEGRDAGHIVVATVEEAAAECRRKGYVDVAFSTTRDLSPEEKMVAGKHGWWEFGPGCLSPVPTKYETPSTLGTDRLAAAIGAASLYPATTIMVADVGTALTLDLVSAEGFHLGGSISPGIEMRLKAMHEFTSRLPKVDAAGETPRLGLTTETAIRSGAVHGLINEIIGATLTAARCYSCRMLVVTGGDGERIMEGLKSEISIIADPDFRVNYYPSLVGEGLKKAYEYNHDKKN